MKIRVTDIAYHRSSIVESIVVYLVKIILVTFMKNYIY